VTSQLKPGKQAKWIAILRDSIVPAVKQQKGFRGFVVLADPHADRGIAYSLWETEADLKATEASGFYQAQIAQLSEVLATPPLRELGSRRWRRWRACIVRVDGLPR
jgi:heme-degrading monooxygenase HmoA